MYSSRLQQVDLDRVVEFTISDLIFPLLLTLLAIAVGKALRRYTGISIRLAICIPALGFALVAYLVHAFGLRELVTSTLLPFVWVFGLSMLGLFVTSPIVYLIFRKPKV
jgi:hypothetical protein